jgi:hypothetical protein
MIKNGIYGSLLDRDLVPPSGLPHELFDEESFKRDAVDVVIQTPPSGNVSDHQHAVIHAPAPS